MTIVPQEQQQEAAAAKPTKEDSLVQLRKGYERIQAENEELRQSVAQLQRVNQVAQDRFQQDNRGPVAEDEDDDGEPYVDKRRLKKTITKFEAQFDQKTEAKIDAKVNQRLAEMGQQEWLRQNPDYNEVIQYAKDLHEKDPELLDSISKMPEGFERNKIVYRSIKLNNLHKKDEPKSSIQDTINKNRQTPFYQPSGIATAPFNAAAVDGKSALAHMRSLSSRITGVQ